jgi:hypothetical protein
MKKSTLILKKLKDEKEKGASKGSWRIRTTLMKSSLICGSKGLRKKSREAANNNRSQKMR